MNDDCFSDEVVDAVYSSGPLLRDAWIMGALAAGAARERGDGWMKCCLHAVRACFFELAR